MTLFSFSSAPLENSFFPDDLRLNYLPIASALEKNNTLIELK